ncbi:Gfo/Idh/MocA family oxidoreductase [Bacillus sp. 166amftsu]|uniref:Gfo/Idh/MocA family protein n=1 Tax=Bacillus sp. 166amftsu TaxID=1761753 RepID=UPI00089D73C7|nr:Gfo/Idh/MocA family oxidoreductase [Bacillus sp. 166amftsu]SDZ40494.1 Predicted dehydrogenase [Bacillus sp. 166amftsu]
MSKKIAVGIIGAGKISQMRHIPEYKNNEHAEILSLCDTSLKRAKEVGRDHQIPHISTDYLDIINSKEIDAISICTPNKEHWSIAVKALKAGKHVLVEKPIATTIEECRDMFKMSNKYNRVIMVGHNQRLSPVHRRVKDLLAQEEIGDILQFTTNFKHGGPNHWSVEGKDTWFFNKEMAGFGVIGDLGIHKIDLFQWLLSDEIKESSAFSSNSGQWEIDENAVIILKMKKGVIGTISLSWRNPLQDHRTVIYGTKGTIIFGDSYFGIDILYNNGKQKHIEVEPYLRNDGLLNSGVVDQFINEIKFNAKPVISKKEIVNSLEHVIKLSRLFV